MAAIASFLGAFLLFALQPLIGKSLLPIYGGGAGPWIACMIFFQLILLAGYAYAHWLARSLGASRALKTHGALALASILVLSIGWLAGAGPWLPKPGGGASSLFPPIAILLTLAASSGLPLVVLAATSPLTQAAFAAIHPEKDPYRLYAVSNAGSFAGLVSYPFLIEPFVDLRVQAWVAALVFLGYLGCLFPLLSKVPPAARAEADASAEQGVVTWKDRLRWLGLSALGTVWLCSVTNEISTDVASVPLLWIPPLAAYLLTFILVFETRWDFTSPAWKAVLVAIVGIYTWIEGGALFYKGLVKATGHGGHFLMDFLYRQTIWFNTHIFMTVSLAILAGFAGCLLAHARLGALRPRAGKLTEYYLFLSAGGAVGGLAVGFLGPMVLNQDLEIYVAIAATGTLVVLSFSEARNAFKWPGLAFGTLAAATAVCTMLIAVTDRTVYNRRDFFGSFFVEFIHPKIMALTHGHTIHGIQFTSEPLRPTGYYGEESGFGIVVRALGSQRPAMKIGVIGLGVGNSAAFGRAGDEMVFFEISPRVIDVSGTQGSIFSVLKASPAKIRVLQGDGRILADQDARQHGPYDLLLIDAFAGGHIPAHLLTVEALQGYAASLKPDGLLLLHVSHNLPLDRQAGLNLRAAGLTGLLLPHGAVVGRSKSGATVYLENVSIYWVASRNPAGVLRPEFTKVAKRAVFQPGFAPPSRDLAMMTEALTIETASITPWTDQRHGLSLLLWQGLRQGSFLGDE